MTGAGAARPVLPWTMNIDLAGRTAIVTGACCGIGLAVTRALAGSGAQVVAGTLHSSAELGELVAEGTVRVVEVDLSDPDGPARLVAMAGERIDILVNNVGGAPPRTAGSWPSPTRTGSRRSIST